MTRRKPITRIASVKNGTNRMLLIGRAIRQQVENAPLALSHEIVIRLVARELLSACRRCRWGKRDGMAGVLDTVAQRMGIVHRRPALVA